MYTVQLFPSSIVCLLSGNNSVNCICAFLILTGNRYVEAKPVDYAFAVKIIKINVIVMVPFSKNYMLS